MTAGSYSIHHELNFYTLELNPVCVKVSLVLFDAKGRNSGYISPHLATSAMLTSACSKNGDIVDDTI